MTKGKKISKKILETKVRRRTQQCKVIEFRVCFNRLSRLNKDKLFMYFIEAKWLYNYILSLKDPFKFDYKTKIIYSLDKDGNKVKRVLNHLPAKCRQDLVSQLKQNIYVLSNKKKRGHKVGRLRFKSDINCIDLSQLNTTHRIVNNRLLKITGIKKPLVVKGLEQIHPDYELENAKLIKKSSGYYIKLTCFENLKSANFSEDAKLDVGVDFGIKDSIITSDGNKYKVSVSESGRLKKLQREFARKVKGSNNRYKAKRKIALEYERLTNKKKDLANKIVNEILSTHGTVYIQDENLKAWHKGWFGKQVQHSALGFIKSKLRQQKSVQVIDRYAPTTRMCYKCGKINILSLSDRIYKCSCGLVEDRDIKAAKTILFLGRCKNQFVPMGHREFKAVERKTSVALRNSKAVSHTSVKQKAKGFNLW